jgi:hypothetical protein
MYMARKKVSGLAEETFKMPCRVFGCNKPAKYRMGNIKGVPNALFFVCEDCLDDIIEDLPEDKLPVKEVEKIVEVEREITVTEARKIVKEADERNEAERRERAKKDKKGGK